MTRRRWVSVSLVAGGLAVAVYPFETVTVPEWKIQYVDPAGRPVSGLKVRQTWQNESVEASPHFALAFTDGEGTVVFPERTVRAPWIVRLLGPVRNVLETGAHASFGSSSWVIPGCDVTEQGGRAVYEGTDLPHRIVVAGAIDPGCSAAAPASVPAGR